MDFSKRDEYITVVPLVSDISFLLQQASRMASRRTPVIIAIALTMAMGLIAGYAFYYRNFDNHLEAMQDEAEVVMALTSSYVSMYSKLSQGTALPVPAEFRAHAADAFNSGYSGRQYFRASMVGMPGRYMVTPPADVDVDQAIVNLRSGNSSSNSELINFNSTLILRSIFPSIATEASCVNCHNSIQKPAVPWKIGDVMGAYVIDREVDQVHTEDVLMGVVVGILVSLVLLAITGAFVLYKGLLNTARLLKKSSETDSLTGCLNRRGLNIWTEKRKQSGSADMAALALDIDHFKHINDSYGHDAGDEVLVEFSSRVRAQLRKRDVLARVGGEEFLIYLVDVSEPMAREIAERICLDIASRPIHLGANAISVTVSIGAVHTCQRQPIAKTLGPYSKIADKHLYAAKETGRNRVVWSP